MDKKLSPFVFGQQIYDYISGKLSASEVKKFESKLKQEKDCQTQLESVKESLAYCQKLNQLEVSQSSLEQIKNFKNSNLFYLFNPLSVRVPTAYKRYCNLSLVFAIFILSVSLVPWKALVRSWKAPVQEEKINSSQDILQLPKKQNQTKNLMAVKKEPKKVAIQANAFALKEEKSRPPRQPLNKKLSTKKQEAQNVKVEKKTKTLKENKVEEKVAQASSSSDVTEKITSSVKEKLKPKTTRGPKGLLYRSYMSLHNLDEMTTRIIALINSLQGEKAGEIELGAKKPKGRYFHLKLPSSKKEELLLGLRDLGVVRVNEEKHWKKMPEGISRVIIWVEDLDLKAQRLKNR